MKKESVGNRLSKSMVAVLAGSFVVSLFLIVRSLLRGTFEKDKYKALIEKIMIHPLTQFLSNPVMLVGIVTLAMAVWIVIYMRDKFEKKTNRNKLDISSLCSSLDDYC